MSQRGTDERGGAAPARALEGVRVLDLTQWEAGSTCASALAFLGADVVKIEKPRGGDPARIASADSPDKDSLYFLVLNSNKRGLTVNLANPAGKILLKRLVGEADIFLENFAPGTIERLGFDYETLRDINPRLIYGSIRGFGDDSPYREFRVFDAIAQSIGGAVSFTGEAGAPPVKPGPTFADTGSGAYLAIGILGALLQRERTGLGQQVRVAMQDVMVNFMRMPLARQQVTGRPAERVGNASPSSTAAPSGLFACRGGGANDHCFIYTARDEFSGNKQWQALLKTIGREDVADDPRFASPEQRFRHQRDVEKVIAPWMLRQDKITAMTLLNNAGVPAGAVLDTGDIIADEALFASGMLNRVDHPTRGEIVLTGWPVRMGASPAPDVASPPLLGEHSADILKEYLGMERDEVATLRAAGVV